MNNSRPAAVIFDLGKVLLDFDYEIAVRRILDKSSVAPESILFQIQHSPILRDYESGALTTHEFYKQISRETGFTGTEAEFSDMFSDIFSPIESMINIQAELRRRGVPTYILSNTNELAINHILARFPFMKNFNGYVYSYEHGSSKPEQKLYEVIEQTTGYSGPHLLYIDDNPDNVGAALNRNWRALVHRCPDETEQFIRAHGLLVDKF
ncbi:MAG: HAD family phosphatase [Verrucomicrobia bacterium]|nr:HAD family phosphatase [Verrucomicrobiota bacterium]MCF7708907.1 HAD family phosphatase [Verrucomicrobiota bacterium]